MKNRRNLGYLGFLGFLGIQGNSWNCNWKLRTGRIRGLLCFLHLFKYFKENNPKKVYF